MEDNTRFPTAIFRFREGGRSGFLPPPDATGLVLNMLILTHIDESYLDIFDLLQQNNKIFVTFEKTFLRNLGKTIVSTRLFL